MSDYPQVDALAPDPVRRHQMKMHKSWKFLAIIAVLALTALILSLIVGCPLPVFVCSLFVN